MNKTRLEAFSDGVIAITITIMVLELKVPHGAEWADLVTPVAIYAFDLMMCAIAYVTLQQHIIRLHRKDSVLAQAVGSDTKGKVSPMVDIAGVPVALLGHFSAAGALLIEVALIWFIPDSRIERKLTSE